MDGVEPLVKAVKKLRGEIHLGNGMVDLSERVGEEFETAGVLRHREVTLLEVAVLPIEDHVSGRTIGKEVLLDPSPEGIGGGGADHMVDDLICQGGIHGEDDMGVNLMVVAVGVGWWWMMDEVGDTVEKEDHQEERFPLVVVVLGGIEKEFDVVGDVIVVDRVVRAGRRRRRGGGGKQRGKLRA